MHQNKLVACTVRKTTMQWDPKVRWTFYQFLYTIFLLMVVTSFPFSCQIISRNFTTEVENVSRRRLEQWWTNDITFPRATEREICGIFSWCHNKSKQRVSMNCFTYNSDWNMWNFRSAKPEITLFRTRPNFLISLKDSILKTTHKWTNRVILHTTILKIYTPDFTPKH